MNPNCQLKSNYRQQREQTPAVIKAKCQRTKPSLPSLTCLSPSSERQTDISARETLINPSNTQRAGHTYTILCTHSNKQAFLGLFTGDPENRLLPLYVTMFSVFLLPLAGSPFVFKSLCLAICVPLSLFPTVYLDTMLFQLYGKTQVGHNMAHKYPTQKI